MAKTNQKSKAPQLALVGGDTLLGVEIKEVLASRETEVVTTAYSATGEGNFGEEDGEAIYVGPLDAKMLAQTDAIVLAGAPEGAKKAYELLKLSDRRPILIDCLGDLDHQPDARIVAPLIEQPDVENGWLFIVAHPAASAIALVLTRLKRHAGIRRTVLDIFEPVSERGKRGVSELHQQTTSLLSFKAIERKVFDAQVSFNLLASYGEDAPRKLAEIEQHIETHLATLLGRQSGELAIPMPSIRLIQAPVFHGYAISAWVEFDRHIRAAELEEALASAQIEIRTNREETPTPVGAASQSGLIAGDIRIDRNNPRAAWFWIVGDNLRLIADAAADLIGTIKAK